jgi:hypothetical protein
MESGIKFCGVYVLLETVEVSIIEFPNDGLVAISIVYEVASATLFHAMAGEIACPIA